MSNDDPEDLEANDDDDDDDDNDDDGDDDDEYLVNHKVALFSSRPHRILRSTGGSRPKHMIRQ